MFMRNSNQNTLNMVYQCKDCNGSFLNGEELVLIIIRVIEVLEKLRNINVNYVSIKVIDRMMYLDIKNLYMALEKIT